MTGRARQISLCRFALKLKDILMMGLLCGLELDVLKKRFGVWTEAVREEIRDTRSAKTERRSGAAVVAMKRPSTL